VTTGQTSPDPSSSPPQPPAQTSPGSATGVTPPLRSPRFTRASAAWVATAAALLFLVMLIVFMLQNPTSVEVHYLGFSGSLSLGMALLIAAVGGGVVVAIAGIARVTQLRLHARRTRHHRQAPDQGIN
jgi:uncharacterized integral membrane protein